jgi:hypothetical protein
MTTSASRRRVVLGLGATALVPVAVSALPARASAETDVEPECLADLIESGEVTRADLVAR